MVNIIIHNGSFNSRERISGLFEFKEDQFCLADVNRGSKPVKYCTTPYRVYLSFTDVSELKTLNEICARYTEVEIIIEATPELYNALCLHEEGWISLI